MDTGRHLDAAPDAMRTPPVPLADAARTLRCSRDALRKRLDRGTLRGVKRHGQWFVYLDAADASVDATTDAAWTPPSGRVDATLDTARELADELRHQRDQLEATVADLRGRLDVGEQAQAELRR